MTREARVVAQAKINLLLHVLSRETSGYHQLETVFLRIDLGDVIEVREAPTRTIRCAGPAMPPEGLGKPEENLAFRAATAYAAAAGWPGGFEITIEKRIPVGAGLGGGSADAGAVLRALDALNPSPLGGHLADVAASVGSDVPFLSIESPMALGWGRGERLLPLPVLEARHVVIIVPPFGVSTAQAYGWLDEQGLDARDAGVIDPASLATWEGIVSLACNDFQDVVVARHPEIRLAIEALGAANAELAMMSGSGSAVFGLFAAPPKTAAIAARVNGRIIETRTSERVVRVQQNQ